MFGKRECRRVSRLIWDYAAGRLPETDGRRVERHLLRCPACRVEAESCRKAVGLLAAYREQVVPGSEGTWHALRSRLESPERPAATAPSLRRAPYRAWSGALVAVLLLCWIGVGRWRSPGDDPLIGSMHGANLNVGPQRLTGSDYAAQKSAAAAPTAGSNEATVATDIAPDRGPIGLALSDKQHRPTLARHSPTAHKPRRHRPNGTRSALRHPLVRHPNPLPAANRLRLAHDILAVDGPVGLPPSRDFVISPALRPLESGPMRHYVMDSIPLSSSRVSHASHEQGAEEIEAW